MALRFKYQPSASGPEIMEALLELVDQISGGGAESVLIADVALVTGENSIRHHMDSPPRGVFAQPHGGDMPTKTRAPDRNFVYLTAAGAQTVDLLVVP